MANYDDDEEPGFLQRHRGGVFLCVAVAVGVGIFFVVRMASHGSHTSSRRDDVTVVRLPPPPPPPKRQPTPPKEQPTPEQQQEQKMVEQKPVENEEKPVPKPPDAPAPLGTSITGPGGGPDMGLGTGLGGGGGYGSGGGGRNGSKYGWYATQVQNRIADAMRTNPRTRKASMNVVVRIWPDSTGRVTKARVSSSGDPALDAALQNDILTNLQLAEPPPSDMPLPIVMRVSARRQ